MTLDTDTSKVSIEREEVEGDPETDDQFYSIELVVRLIDDEFIMTKDLVYFNSEDEREVILLDSGRIATQKNIGNYLEMNIQPSNERFFDLFSVKCTHIKYCLLYTSPSPRDQRGSRMPSSA